MLKVCEALCIQVISNAFISQRNSPWYFLLGLCCSVLHLNLLPRQLLLFWPRWPPNCSKQRHCLQKWGPEPHVGNSGCPLPDYRWVREGMGQGQKMPQSFSTALRLTFSWFSIQLLWTFSRVLTNLFLTISTYFSMFWQLRVARSYSLCHFVYIIWYRVFFFFNNVLKKCL